MRTGSRRFQRAVSVQDGQNLLVANGLEGTFVHHCLDERGLFRRAAGERVDHRHGSLAFTQIAGDRLAETSSEAVKSGASSTS